MKENIKNYTWFIKESQSYMHGYNPVIVFFKSLWLGIGFCKDMNKSNRRVGNERQRNI